MQIKKAPTNVIAMYKITYENGITQVKNLISHNDYEQIIKPTLQQIYELEINQEKKMAQALKMKLKNMFGSNYFTTQSPLHEAISTGYLQLLAWQGGKQKCLLQKQQ